MPVTVCTIVARNYLPHARVLTRSFKERHPDGEAVVLLIDETGPAARDTAEPFHLYTLADIGLSAEQIAHLVAYYDVTELATAVKPPFLRTLLDEGRDAVVYLDPDIKVYERLEDAATLATRHGIVLIPHMLTSIPADGRGIDDFHVLAAGVFNLGFIAVGARARPFLDWWWSKTEHHALIEPAQMMFTDQRWIDLVPAFFDHHVVRDRGWNVAYWNLHERDLAWTGTAYAVDDRPLAFFHFSGFDWRRPYLLSRHQGSYPRILLSERPGVRRICAEYAADLVAAGADTSPTSYRWNRLPSGLAFAPRMKRLYREAVRASVTGGDLAPPSPFQDEGRFLGWLNELVAGGLRPRITRYTHAIYRERIDLQTAFPDLAGADGPRYVEWLWGDGVVQEQLSPALLPPRVPPPDPLGPDELTDGVNLFGYFEAELGVGEAARLLSIGLDAGSVRHATTTWRATLSRQQHGFSHRGGDAPHDVNLVVVNADQTPTFWRAASQDLHRGRYTIGYWFWELAQFPHALHEAFDYVDEVWTASHFVADAIRGANRKPVHTVPLPVLTPRPAADCTREQLGLPSGFVFTFVFDFLSISDRKNPWGTINAFTRAFRPGEGPTLLLKTINGHLRLSELERLRAAAADRPDIRIVDGYYGSGERDALLAMSDCYVSLHRSEGLGLTMAEAMAAGTPVIATGYSGNLQFMTPENSYLVDYDLAMVPAGCAPYPAGSHWAEPDLDHAASLMRRVVEHRTEPATKARRARQDVLTKHSPQRTAAAIVDRLDAIRMRRGRASRAQAEHMAIHGVWALGDR